MRSTSARVQHGCVVRFRFLILSFFNGPSETLDGTWPGGCNSRRLETNDEEQCIRFGIWEADRLNLLNVIKLDAAERESLIRLGLFDLGPVPGAIDTALDSSSLSDFCTGS